MAKGVSSYKYQFISPPPDDVICSLCLDILEEPQQFTCCGHHVCRDCGEKFKQQSTLCCPTCRDSEYTLSPDKYFERNTLNKLSIWCTEGCGQKIELGQLKRHLSQCPYVEQVCPNGCGEQCLRQCMHEHNEKCPKRPFTCDYCEYKSTYMVIVNEHYPVCDKYPINCPNECSQIERGMLQDHLDKCPLRLVDCVFNYVGCKEKPHYCDLPQHLSEYNLYHNALSSQMIYTSLQKMMEEKDRQIQEKDKQLQEKDDQLARNNEELRTMAQERDKQLQEKDAQLARNNEELRTMAQEKDRQLQEKDNKIDLLYSEVCELKEKTEKLQYLVGNIHDHVCHGDVVLSVTMTDFQYKRCFNQCWCSPPYFTYTLGYKMCFEVEFGATTLQIKSYMMKGPYDDDLKWPFEGEVIVRLLNQKGEYHHYNFVFDYEGSGKGRRVTKGKRQRYLQSTGYLLYDELNYHDDTNCQYLRDDCLMFKVIVVRSLYD